MHLQCTCNALAFNKFCKSENYGTFSVVVVFKVTKPINPHGAHTFLKDVAKIWKIKI